ncbi:MAG: carboxypeptidase regulatory-like domain-containing protein [Planctomycetes bacterium]|nr:carboxypeptidase regulatory-like domain-containing protein [Planctomycetota bacterium]
MNRRLPWAFAFCALAVGCAGLAWIGVDAFGGQDSEPVTSEKRPSGSTDAAPARAASRGSPLGVATHERRGSELGMLASSWDELPAQIGPPSEESTDGFVIRGRAVDGTGRAVAGALVFCELSALSTRRARARTDSEGRFWLALPFVQGHFIVDVRDGAHRARTISGSAVARSVELGEVELLSVPTIRGTVTEPGGAPIPGARMILWDPLHLRSWDELGNPQPIALTDAFGRFEIPGGHLTRVAVEAEAPHREAQKLFAERKGDLWNELNFVLPPAKQAEGLVLDRQGQPIRSAFVEAYFSGEGHQRVSETDRNGRFRVDLEAEPKRLQVLRVYARGFQAKSMGVREGEFPATIELDAIGPLRIFVEQEPADGPIEAHSIQFGDRWNEQADGFSIRTLDPSEWTTAGPAQWLIHVPRFEDVSVVLTTKNGRIFQASNGFDPVQQEPNSLQLVEPMQLIGRVLSRTGVPVARALVEVSSAKSSREFAVAARTDREGRFRVQGIRMSTARIVVRIVSAEGVRAPEELAQAEGETDLGDLELDACGSLELRAMAAGRPGGLAHAFALWRDTEGPAGLALQQVLATGRDGRAIAAPLPIGRYILAAEPPTMKALSISTRWSVEPPPLEPILGRTWRVEVREGEQAAVEAVVDLP